MICPSCNNGILSPSLLRSSIISYRGFNKAVGTYVVMECSSCSYESTEPLNSTVDMDQELILFKIEVNGMLSGGLEL